MNIYLLLNLLIVKIDVQHPMHPHMPSMSVPDLGDKKELEALFMVKIWQQYWRTNMTPENSWKNMEAALIQVPLQYLGLHKESLSETLVVCFEFFSLMYDIISSAC